MRQIKNPYVSQQMRQSTNRLLEMLDHGMISTDAVVRACLSYMSEDEVTEMCHMNEFFTEEEEEETE